jgi:protein-L-isoaspartate O-methyltransferase
MFQGVAFRAWGRDQQELVQRLVDNEVVRSPGVERAFRLADRALFVPYAANAQAGAARAAAERAVAAGEAEDIDAALAAQAAQAEQHPLHMPRATPAELAAAKEQSYMDAPVKVGAVHISGQAASHHIIHAFLVN